MKILKVLMLSLAVFGLSIDTKFTPTVSGDNVCFPFDQADQLRQAFENQTNYQKKITFLSNQINWMDLQIMEIDAFSEHQKSMAKKRNIRVFFMGFAVGSGSTVAVILAIIIKNAFF